MSFFSSWFAPQDKDPEKNGRAFPFIIRRIVTSTDYLKPQRWNWDLVTRPIDDSIGKSLPSSLADTKERILGLRYFLFDGLFATISDNFFVNYIVLFALAYNATNSQIGFLTAFANLLGTVALFPGAREVERLGHKKAIVVWSGGFGSRLPVLLLAFLPLAVRDGLLGIAFIILLHSVRSFFGNFANPAWTSMVADLVPTQIRGKYLSSRNNVMGIAALIVAPVAGFVIRHGNGWRGYEMFGYQAVFFLAFVFGMMSMFCFSKIPEPIPLDIARRKHTKGDLRRALKGHLPFVGFLVSASVWNIAIQLSAPFFNVYMVTNLGSSVSEVGIAAGVASLAAILGQFVFGNMLDRKGNLRVQSLTGLAVPFIPLFWMLATASWHVYLVNFFGSFFWAGYNLSNFNLLLELSPERQRPRAVALYQTVVFTGAVLGPALGGFMADTVSYRMNFAVSGVGRAVGILLFLVLVARPVLKKKASAEPVPGRNC